MFCNKGADDKLVKGAVEVEGALERVFYAVSEKVNQKAVQPREQYINQSVGTPEIAAGVVGIPCWEKGGNPCKNRVKKEVSQTGRRKKASQGFFVLLPG